MAGMSELLGAGGPLAPNMTTRSALYLGMLETIKARSDAASAATVLATRTAMNSITRPCQMQPIENSF